ncbi:uncharacterized protein LOC128550396 [Mercenaria mercenaria]|uniref:uncharacterized protein LOC128550396 n=1 Tax=Mercenaria mercenaria TaxID=6596 RepID=UPI00234F6326|nr:uncharacterized protein LOC128550396 [Mercenaria mercenaria]XP_053385344.1 uncharacterized protein LOC128550396 [Mercenaria mercenaria]XP_053385345.1 uncharacterized protein LOC128550396 [Mercenaria mercenaria]
MENQTCFEYNNCSNHSNGSYYAHFGGPAVHPVSEFIYDYICPVLAVVGIVCNTITFIALLRPPINSISVSVYLKAYCIAAILTWILMIKLNWVLDKSESRHFSSMSQISCRIWSFLTCIVTFSGFWFITGAAVDRVFILWTPIKAQSLCTVFMAKNAVVFILIGLTAVSIHALWMYNMSPQFICYFERGDYFNRLWLWASGFLLGCLPLILLFTFGNLMIIRFCLKHHGRQMPDLSKNEIDVTYAVMIISLIVFSCAMPSNVLHFMHIMNDENGRSLTLLFEFATYISWICYLCVFYVLIIRCNVFRDSLKDAFNEIISRLRRKRAHIELKTLKPEYNQVPSTSTSV